MENEPSIKFSEIKLDGPVEMLRIPSIDSIKPPPLPIEEPIQNLENPTASTTTNVANQRGLQVKSKQVGNGKSSSKKRRSRNSKYSTKEPHKTFKPTTIVIDRRMMHDGSSSKSKRHGIEIIKSTISPALDQSSTHGLSTTGPKSSTGSSASKSPIEDIRDSRASPMAMPQQRPPSRRSRDKTRNVYLKSKRQPELNQHPAQVQDTQETAPRYSWNHLQLAMARGRHAGRITMFIFWLSFSVFTLVIDYMKLFEKASDPKDVPAVGVGIISNMDNGLFGWLILLLVLMLIFEIFKDFLSTRNSCVTIIACVLIVLVHALIIIFYIIEQKWNKEGIRHNAYLVIVHLVIWFFWLLYETYQLCSIVFSMQELRIFPELSI